MSFKARLWAMTIVCFGAFTLWIFVHDEALPGLSDQAYQILLAITVWIFGLAGTVLINRLHHRAEKLAERAARDDTVIQLAGGIAHELNQPLTIIISTAELLSRRDPTKDDIRPYLQQLIQASERTSDIVHKLEKVTSYRSKPYVGGVSIVDLDERSDE
ncbi:MAG: histidine kinase dimerization/phospho-acceptor domain-containing protein [Sphingomonadaceae bacterium]